MQHGVDLGTPLTDKISDVWSQFKWANSDSNVNAQTCRIVASPYTASGFAVQYVTDDSDTIPSQDGGSHVRLHEISFATKPSWYAKGSEFYSFTAVAATEGYDCPNPTVLAEDHGGLNAQGVAPYRLAAEDPVGWRIFAAGGKSNADYDRQAMFGPAEHGGSTREPEFAWLNGGNKKLVRGEPIVLVRRFIPDESNGQIQVWAFWKGLADWREIVSYSGPTCYPDFGGPFWSQYYDHGSGKAQSFTCFANGFAPSRIEALAALAERVPLLLPNAGPIPDPPPPPPATSEPMNDFWKLMVLSTPYKNWAATPAGKRDHDKLVTFAKGSDTVPKLETNFGKACLQSILERVKTGLPAYTGKI